MASYNETEEDEEGSSSVLSTETVQETPQPLDLDDDNDDDSEDVMEGLEDDDDDDSDNDSVSASPMRKLIPSSLTHNSNGALHSLMESSSSTPSPSSSPLTEKGVDRLVLLARYPHAHETQIQQVLQQNQLQQQAARIVATRKAQLYKEKRDHEEAAQRLQEELAQKETKRQQQHPPLPVSRNLFPDPTPPQTETVDEETGGFFEDDFGVTITPEAPAPLSEEEHSTGRLGDVHAILRRSSTSGTDEETNSVDESQAFFQMSMSGGGGTSSDLEDTVEERRSNHADALSLPPPHYQNHHHPPPRRSFLGKFLKVFSSSNKLKFPAVPSSSGSDLWSDGAATLGDNDTKISNPASMASAMTRKISNTSHLQQQQQTTTTTKQPFVFRDNDVGDTGSSHSYDNDTIGETTHTGLHTTNNNNKNANNNNTNISMRSDQRQSAKNFHQYNDGSFDEDDDAESIDEEAVISQKRQDQQAPICVCVKRHLKIWIVILSLIIVGAVVVTVLAAMNVFDPESTATTTTGISSSSSNMKNNNNNNNNDFNFTNPTIKNSLAPTWVPSASPTIIGKALSDNMFDAGNNDGNFEGSSSVELPARETTTSPSTAQPTVGATETPTDSPTASPSSTNSNSPTRNQAAYTEDETTLLKGFAEEDRGFGSSVALSRDGQTLVVGAPQGLSEAGIVRIYQKNRKNNKKDDTPDWTTTGSLRGNIPGDQSGTSLAISRDGTVLAVGRPYASNSQGDNKAGIVQTYVYSPFGYQSRGPDLEGADATDHFGTGLAISQDGLRLAVGAPYHDNSNNDGSEQDRSVSGSVYVYEFSEKRMEWVPLGSPLEGIDHMDWFGWTLDLSHDGSVLCAGAPRHLDSGGYVRCFEFRDNEWEPLGSIIQNRIGWIRYDDFFGGAVSLSQDPTNTKHRVAIGAHGKNDGPNATDSGLVVVYEIDPTRGDWTQLGGRRGLAPTTLGDNHKMGFSLDLQQDTLAVGIPGANNNTGRVELYRFDLRPGFQWARSGVLVGEEPGGFFGSALDTTPGGDLVVGSPLSDNARGSVHVYEQQPEEADLLL